MPIPIKISASTGATILGLNNWQTPIEAWLKIMEIEEPGFCEKNNYEQPEVLDSPEIHFGHAFEHAVIELAEYESEDEILDQEKLFIVNDFITCHIDGRYKNKNILHEGKTTSVYYFRDNFGDPGTDRVPIQYQIQCQHQMLCTGLDKVILSVLVFPFRASDLIENGLIEVERNDSIVGFKNKKTGELISTMDWAQTLDEMGFFHQYIVERNDELIEKMIEKYLEWWDKHIINCTPPNPPEKYSDIRKLIRAPSGTILSNDEIESISSEYKALGKEAGEIEKRKDFLKTKLLDEMNKQIKTKDYESVDKWILRDGQGKKLHQYDGKRFR